MRENGPENVSSNPCITHASEPLDPRVKRLVESGGGISIQLAKDWIAFYDEYKPTPMELISLMDETDPTMIAMRERSEAAKRKAVQP